MTNEEGLPVTLTAVAIDRDKNSQNAVRWAVDHLLINTHPSITLLHVRNKKTSSHSFSVTDGSPEAGREQLEAEIQQLFLPFRGFCARRGIAVKEVVLEDIDTSKAIVDFIGANCIHNIVVGASGRNALIRKFKHPDVATTVSKIAPDFCAVYTISKGKVNVRSANRRAPIPTISPGLPPAPEIEHRADDPAILALHHRPAAIAVRGGGGPAGFRSPAPSYMDRRSFDRPMEQHSPKGSAGQFTDHFRPLMTARSGPPTLSGLDMISTTSDARPRSSHIRGSPSGSFDFQSGAGAANTPGFQSLDFNAEGIDFTSAASDSPRLSSAISKEVEAEMKRLKLELKQTMDMYSTACKEAISAKQKANELRQWKMEEARRFEEARMAEEAAIAMAEMEKAKCRAAMEKAEAAQRMAGMEAQKRKNAEMKAMRESEEKKRALDALAHNDVRYRKYNIDEIEVATDFFSDKLKIGEGGYGPVYKAILDHTPVAIKVLRPDAAQGRKQFQQEVEVLSCIRHPNMVLLLGACPEYGCLVYEFMENGSLEDRLFRRGNTPPIPWRTRFKIAAEVATALLFLHQTRPEPLVHRDLKPANILLDRNYVSKISDVGLARLVPPSVADSVTQYRMTSTAGTFCYIDPEYQQTGMLGTKSDIYSLGVLLLQIVTAKPPMGLTHHVERALDKGTFSEMLDPTVPDWPVDEAISYARLALRCSELCRKDRPSLGSVVLPELNRLRKLGMSHEEGAGPSRGLRPAPKGRTSSNPRARLHINKVNQLDRATA